MVENGTVTFCFEGTADEVQTMTEQIIEAVSALNLPVHVSEDTWEEDEPEINPLLHA